MTRDSDEDTEGHDHGPVDCRRLEHLIGDYADDQLSPQVKSAVDAHIGACAPCLAFMRQYRFAPEAVRKHLLRAVPAELESRVLAFLRERCGKKS